MRATFYVSQVLEYPWQTLHYLKLSLLKMIERHGVKWIWSSFPTKQFYLLLIAYLLPMLSISFVISTLSTAAFVAAFIAMSVATLQVVLNSEKVSSLMEYSNIFRYFNETGMAIDTRVPETQLIRHSIGPYVTFLVSLLIAVVTQGLAHSQLILVEPLCIVAAFFAAVAFFQFQCYKSPLILLSISTRLISWVYTFLLLVTTWIPLPGLLFFAGKEIIVFPIFNSVSFDINLMTLLQFPIQLGITVYLLYKYSWHNFYSGLGPYFLFLCWWVLCRNFLSQSQLFYLFMFTFGVLVFISLVPFLPILIIFSPFLILFYYGVSRLFFVSLSLVVITSVLLLLVLTNFSRLKEAKWLNIRLEYLFLIQILISIPLFLIGSSMYAQWYSPPSLPAVTINEYAEYCGPKNWEHGNMVQTQLNCLHLESRLLHAHGTVRSVKILQVSNDKEASLRALPSSIQTALLCLFGQTEPICGNRDNMTTCVKSGCHFHFSDKFRFEITLDMADDLNMVTIPAFLIASNKFKPLVLKIRSGTKLFFNATFIDGMGSDKLTLQASSLSVEDEMLGGPAEEDDEEETEKMHILTRLVSSLKDVLCFILEILIGYTIPNKP